MTTPTGQISMSDIMAELGISGTTSLNDSDVRGLAGISSGQISFSSLRGKSAWSVSVGDALSIGHNSDPLQVTMTVTGAPAGATFSWSKVSGDSSISLSGPTTNSSVWVTCSTPGLNGNADAVIKCTVTSGGTSKSASGTASFDWETSGGGGGGGGN